MKLKSVMLLTLITLFITATGITVAETPDASQGIYTGVFLDQTQTMASFEKMVGKKMALQMWFTNFTNDATTNIPVTLIKANKKLGKISMVTWEPWTDLNSILQGKLDAYLQRNARLIAELKIPVMIRFAHEMNGNWYSWDGHHNGGLETKGFGDPNLADGPERYVAAFRHVVDLFRKEGATNVLWVWAVNESSVPNEAWNDMLSYYPGDQYVDWIGIDGYNWGTTRSFSKWTDFQSIFRPSYDKLTQAIPNKPVIIAEFASTETGGNKAAWITDAFTQMKKFPRLHAFVWFSVYKETAWSVDSSDEALEAFTKAMKDKTYLDRFSGF
ncbi:MAG TPA: glycosyl hydrolase [Bacillota bacterium]|nr:glycosyl hydrolase [Bacillota bacterium]